MYNKIIIIFGFCDIQNNQGRVKDYLTSTFGICGFVEFDRNFNLISINAEEVPEISQVYLLEPDETN